MIRVLSRLPGIGRRSAERMAYLMLGTRRGLIGELKAALERAERDITFCPACGNFKETDEKYCSICRDPQRSGDTLCIVEAAPDIQIMEQARVFPGRYFCLGGKASPQAQESVTDERLQLLSRRLQKGEIKEVLLALNTDTESEATAHMLHEFLQHFSVKVSRLAFGLPAGSGLAYSDPETLGRAIQGRQGL